MALIQSTYYDTIEYDLPFSSMEQAGMSEGMSFVCRLMLFDVV